MQEDDQHDNRHDVPDHHGIELFSAEHLSATLHLLGNPCRFHDPSDQDRGEQRDKGHHKAVADVVHDVQQLPGTAVGERSLHIENAVSQQEMK